MKYQLAVIGCPPATQDVPTNLRNRAWAIQNVSYGPANPALDAWVGHSPNDAYWDARARVWGTTRAIAKTMRCGNCAAFNVSDRIKSCIEVGVGGDVRDVDPFIAAGELGYCMAFKFKCAALRTCDAWVVGGPVRVERG